METITELLRTYNVPQELDPATIQTLRTEKLQVERLVIKLDDGSERMFYRQARRPVAHEIIVSGQTVRHKSCWHRDR